MNIAYTCNSLLCAVMYLVSHFKQIPYMAFLAFSLTLFRNEIRGLDLEQTYDPTRKREWVFLVCAQMFATAINISIITNNFNFHKSKLVVLLISFVLILPTLFNSINVDEEDESFIEFLTNYSYGFFFIFYYIFA